jgi:predicted aspartyl protease
MGSLQRDGSALGQQTKVNGHSGKNSVKDRCIFKLPCALLLFLGLNLIALALVPALAPALAAPASPGASVQRAATATTDKRSQAIALYNAKDYQGAAFLLDDYLTVNSRDPYAAYYAALANQQIGNSAKSRIYYRQVFTLAPTSQIGGYARDMLLKVDPSFAAAMANTKPSKTAVPSTEEALAKAIVDLPSGNDEVPALDPTLPAEFRMPFTKSWQGVYLDGSINGRAMKLKFDTGAPNVVIGKNHLQSLGMAAPTGKPDGYTGGSASADKVPFWMVNTTVKVGLIEKRNLPIQVLEYDHSDPLLGQTFFKTYDCNIDESSGQICFRQKAITAKQTISGAAVSVPFVFKEEGNRVLVDVEVNGKPTTMIFDTGNTASACSFMSVEQAERAGVKIPADAVITQHTGVSGSGSAKVFTIRKLRLGPIEHSDVWISVNLDTTDSTSIGAPLLGQPFWQGYEYTIDRKKRLIYFIRR